MGKYLLLASLSLLLIKGLAQTPQKNQNDSTSKKPVSNLIIEGKNTIYLLPNGNRIRENKIDSLQKAWGKGRMAINHNAEDDAKGIVHLVYVSDAMMNQLAQQIKQNDSTLNTLLGKKAPDFQLKDLEHKNWNLSALIGKVVVMNFWFTTCPPCIEEMPEFNKLKSKYDSNKVVFLALTFNDPITVQKFLKSHPFNFIILPKASRVNDLYLIQNFPTTLIVDKLGYITFHSGYSPELSPKIGAAIDAAL